MPDNPEHPLRRLWHHAANRRRTIAWATTYSFLNKAFDIAPPVLIGMAVDVVVRREDSFLARWVVNPRDQLVLLALITFGVWGLESVFEYAYSVRWRNLAQAIQHDLRIETYGHVQTLDQRYFEDASTGGLMSVLNDDVNQLERFLDHGANDIIQVLTTVVLIGGAFFVIAPEIAWLSFLPIPIILWGSFKFQKQIAPRYEAVRSRVADVNALLANNLSGITTIKAFVAEDREVDRLAGESDLYREANRDAIKLSSAFTPLIRIAILIGFTATLVWGGFRTLEGAIEIGAYSVMIFLTQRLLWPLTRLGETVDLYQRAMASTNRIMDLLTTDPGMAEGAKALPDQVSGHLELDSVSFEYVDGFPVLENVSMRVIAGETVAIVGPTGSGKTSMVKLLLRLYDPTSGVVSLDGVDVRGLRYVSLRSQFGLVSQDVFLFHGTVRDNIAYGVPHATLEDVVEAAKTAEAHDFITDLPLGYDTIVGERGQKLSGGQRQRVSIARAVLLDPPILVLDEATSAVDNETEAAIQRSLELVSRDRTTVVIAHRLSTIRHADRIYVLDRGRITEVGTHEQLVDSPGTYASLWNVQTGKAVPWHVEPAAD